MFHGLGFHGRWWQMQDHKQLSGSLLLLTSFSPASQPHK